MPHEIDIIKQAAHELEKIRGHIAEKQSNGLGCYISLHFAFETSVDKAVDILLAKKTSLGENIKKECDNLLKNAKLIDDLYEKNESEARIKETEILVSVRRLISRLEQIAQNARKESGTEKPEGTEEKATSAKIINIENFKGILGDVQAGNLQIAQDASIHEQSVIKEKKKGILRRLLKIIGAIVVGIIVTVVTDILGDFGWIERIKTIVHNILTNK